MAQSPTRKQIRTIPVLAEIDASQFMNLINHQWCSSQTPKLHIFKAPEDLTRLHLAQPVDLRALKLVWLAALDQAASFIQSRPPDELGCLYFSPQANTFVLPQAGDDAIPHYGRPGGVVPIVS